jgi:ABC-type dipeptide/oligopeptide/nickel transport system permease component
VWDEFVPRFKATLELGVCAMIFAVAVGIPVGVLAPLSVAPFSITPPLAWR